MQPDPVGLIYFLSPMEIAKGGGEGNNGGGGGEAFFYFFFWTEILNVFKEREQNGSLA